MRPWAGKRQYYKTICICIIAHWGMPPYKIICFWFYFIFFSFVYYFLLVLGIKWLIQVSNIKCFKCFAPEQHGWKPRSQSLSFVKHSKKKQKTKKNKSTNFSVEEEEEEGGLFGIWEKWVCMCVWVHTCVSPDPRVQFMWIKLQAELPLSPFQHNAFLS